jgi:hypothetical protein
MQENQIGQTFTGLAPADMLRLPHLINTKIVFSSKCPSPSAGATPILNLPGFTREIIHFWLDILLLLYFLYFYALHMVQMVYVIGIKNDKKVSAINPRSISPK